MGPLGSNNSNSLSSCSNTQGNRASRLARPTPTSCPLPSTALCLLPNPSTHSTPFPPLAHPLPTPILRLPRSQGASYPLRRPIWRPCEITSVTSLLTSPSPPSSWLLATLVCKACKECSRIPTCRHPPATTREMPT